MDTWCNGKWSKELTHDKIGNIGLEESMQNVLVYLTATQFSLLRQEQNSVFIRDRVKGEPVHQIDGRDSIAGIIDAVEKAKLLKTNSIVRLVYTDDVDKAALDVLVDYLQENSTILEINLMQSVLIELLLKKKMISHGKAYVVQVANAYYKLQTGDSITLHQIESTKAAKVDAKLDDVAFTELFSRDFYLPNNANDIEQEQKKHATLNQELLTIKTDNKELHEKLTESTTKYAKIVKQLDSANEKQLIVQNKELICKDRKVITFNKIAVISQYIEKILKYSSLSYFNIPTINTPTINTLTIEPLVETTSLITVNQPLFKVTYESAFSIIKASQAGYLFIFSDKLKQRKEVTITRSEIIVNGALDSKLVFCVISHKDDNIDDIRKWCWEQGYDIFDPKGK